ncbi:uncharacterized protein LOC119586297 [Penaeus monodon]|uniref:uncharacterized protein LOC119586297 n=1 Tax=Penaeus monodon TaxID=6687 RepID=UPI0018A78708|nr:uncharacterized protein LOC119586297 [Penaeus monodon]
MPKDLDTITRGDVEFRSTSTGILCMQWFNQYPLPVLSTVHTSELVTEKSRFGIECTKPRAVSGYHAAVRGTRQLALSFPEVQDSVVWYKKVIFDLLNMAVVNACVHKAVGGGLILFEFKGGLIRQLIPKSASTRIKLSRMVSKELRLQGATTHNQ